jgi:FkbM family methyltransferase
MRCGPLRRLVKKLLVREGSRVHVPLAGGLVLALHPAKHRDLWFREDWEKECRDALRRLVRPGDVVWDIGANIGFYTLLFAMWVGPTGRVVAFEPDAENLAFLSENVERNALGRTVRIVPAAVSNRSGTGALAGEDSFTHRLVAADAGGRQVDTVGLDDFVRTEAEALPALVKLDVEGHEGPAVEGMERILREGDVTVFMEVHGDVSAMACARTLGRAGYSCTDALTGRPVDLESVSDRCWVLARRQGSAQGSREAPAGE